MTELLSFGVLKTGVSSLNAFLSLLKDEVADMLYKVGESHFAAALRALDDCKNSNNCTRELESAITTLREAYYSFYSAGESRGIRRVVSIFLPMKKRAYCYKNACISAVMIALCYYYLDEKRTGKSYISDALDSFSKYRKAWLDCFRYDPELPNTWDQSEYQSKCISAEKNELDEIIKLIS